MLTLVIIASLLIVGLSIYQYQEQGKEYHIKRLLRKENTIKATIKNELDRFDSLVKTNDLKLIFSDQIYKIRDIHKLDIEIYNLQGNLLISSSPTFANDPTNYDLTKNTISEIKKSNTNRFLANKKINEKTVQWSYTYIINKKFEPIGVLGLPYLQDNTEQNRELREFLNRIIIAFLPILLFAIIIAYWLSRFITKSIKAVSEKISKTVLGTRNEKVEVANTSKEISTLVNAYNSMVDKLEESAVKLAKSEREEAWREMAKQVAHEIKNPLTPMRLTVQSFQRKFNPNDPGSKEKLNEYSKTLLDQIDTLTSIASAFSNFAKMPTAKKEKLNVVEVTKHATDIFSENFIEFTASKKEVIAQLDKTQLIRIVTNLVKNAIQASNQIENPKIVVSVTEEQKNVIIAVKDNGKGISDEHKDKVFEPKFTTKSSGMGLGLPMIKNIIEAYNGKITFTSQINNGTTFIVTLPKE
jgi:signal transduction histidine kinase